MKTYKIIKPVTLESGVVRLTDEQARTRAHKIEAIKGKKGLYRITGPNQFKAGEEIGYEGDLPKMLATDMESLDPINEDVKKNKKAQVDARALWFKNEELREQYANDIDAYFAAVLEPAA